MLQGRLNNCGSSCSQCTDSLDLKEVAYVTSYLCEHRIRIFGFYMGHCIAFLK